MTENPTTPPAPTGGATESPRTADKHAGFDAFWREHRYATLTTVRPDGTPHVVPVSVTYEPPAPGEDGHGTARVVSRRGSKKVRNIAAAPDGMRVALCQVHGGRWSTLEGVARIHTDAESVADAEERYEQRYGRRPSPNPERVLIRIAVDRTMGRTPAV